jgi:hypothetical protein
MYSEAVWRHGSAIPARLPRRYSPALLAYSLKIHLNETWVLNDGEHFECAHLSYDTVEL